MESDRFAESCLRAAPVLALAIALTACASAGENGSNVRGDELAGSRWRLVEFESSDDAIGVQRPHDPDVYIMELHSDSTVAMQLNCNRATGTWSAESTGGGSGSFTFGPVGVTRALCPPPSMDEQIALHIEHVRSYVLRDGRLHLALMADGGIYVWEPAGSVQ